MLVVFLMHELSALILILLILRPFLCQVRMNSLYALRYYWPIFPKPKPPYIWTRCCITVIIKKTTLSSISYAFLDSSEECQDVGLVLYFHYCTLQNKFLNMTFLLNPPVLSLWTFAFYSLIFSYIYSNFTCRHKFSVQYLQLLNIFLLYRIEY